MKFSSEHQPAKNGRKQKGYTLFNAYLKNLGYAKPSKSDYLECMQLVVSLDDDDFEIVKQSKETPKFVKILMECLESERIQSKLLLDLINYNFPKVPNEFDKDVQITIVVQDKESAELLLND